MICFLFQESANFLKLLNYICQDLFAVYNLDHTTIEYVVKIIVDKEIMINPCDILNTESIFDNKFVRSHAYNVKILLKHSYGKRECCSN